MSWGAAGRPGRRRMRRGGAGREREPHQAARVPLHARVPHTRALWRPLSRTPCSGRHQQLRGALRGGPKGPARLFPGPRLLGDVSAAGPARRSLDGSRGCVAALTSPPLYRAAHCLPVAACTRCTRRCRRASASWASTPRAPRSARRTLTLTRSSGGGAWEGGGGGGGGQKRWLGPAPPATPSEVVQLDPAQPAVPPARTGSSARRPRVRACDRPAHADARPSLRAERPYDPRAPAAGPHYCHPRRPGPGAGPSYTSDRKGAASARGAVLGAAPGPAARPTRPRVVG